MLEQVKDQFLGWADDMRSLTPDQQPVWGRMTPQHMVEHIVGSWRISNGRAQVKPVLPPEAIEERRAFLFSDRPYEKNITNPVFPGQLPTLRKPDLSSAIDQLKDEMTAFFTYHAMHEGAIEMHPVFGELNAEGWITFQTKHMKHHMEQFGLL